MWNYPGLCGWVLNPMTSVLRKGQEVIDTEKVGGRDESDVTTSWGHLESPEAGRGEVGFSPRAFRGSAVLPPLCLWTSGRKGIPVISSHEACLSSFVTQPRQRVLTGDARWGSGSVRLGRPAHKGSLEGCISPLGTLLHGQGVRRLEDTQPTPQ